MGEIVPFVFKHDQEETPIRTLTVDGEPWFVAVDVCVVLGLENTTKALRPLDPDEITLTTIQGERGPRELNIISEPGLYALIEASRKPPAKAFSRWLRHEVLPALRKNGRYELPSVAPTPDLLTAINTIAETQKEMQADIRDIKVKQNADRENFSRPTVRYVAEGTALHNNCECWYCNDTVIVTKHGERIEGRSHEHHINGNRADIRPENCALPCRECHERITNPSRPDHIPAHIAQGIGNTQHRKLKQKAQQIKPPDIMAARPLWDFRGAVQGKLATDWPLDRRSA